MKEELRKKVIEDALVNGRVNMSSFHNELKKLIKETPIKTRIEVVNEMAFMSLITTLGFREKKMWTDDEEELLKTRHINPTIY